MFDITLPDIPVYDQKGLPSGIPRKYQFSVIVGRRQSGKSVLLFNLIKKYYRHVFDLVLVVSPSAFLDPVWKGLENYKNVVFLDECSPEILKLILQVQEERAKQGKDLCMIIDDFGANHSLQGKLNDIATRGRHKRLMCVSSLQYLRQVHPMTRNNVDNFIIFKLTDKEFKKLAEDVVYDEDAFLQIANTATEKPYNFLYIDFRKSKEEMFSRGFPV